MLPTSFGIRAAVGLLWVWPIGPRIKKRMEDKKVARASAEQTRNAGVSSSPAALVPTAGCRIRPTASIRSIASIGSILSNTPVYPVASIHTTSSIGRHIVRPAASTHSIVSVGGINSSIGCHHERTGSYLAEYNQEEGAFQFSIAESVKSLKLTIDSQVEEEPEVKDVTEYDEHS